MGEARRGRRPIVHTSKKSVETGKLNISFIVSRDGLYGFDWMWSSKDEKGYDTDEILKMLDKVLPLVPAGTILCWDKASFHTTPRVADNGIWHDEQVTPYLLPTA